MRGPALSLVACIALAPTVSVAQHAAVPPMAAHPVALAPAPPPASVASPVGVRTQAELSSLSRAPGAHFHSALMPARTSHTPPRSHPRPMPPARPADIPVPGLGFDAVHFAATHPNDTDRKQRQRQELSFFFPFFGGLPFESYAPVEENGEAHQAQQIAEAPQYDEPTPRSWWSRGESRGTTSAPAPDAAAPQPENQEYIFVRSDGTVFFAIAFSWDKEMLRYVTREGLRQSAARSSLDLDATRQFNEQRGLLVRPAT
jgi:hypothetical protein